MKKGILTILALIILVAALSTSGCIDTGEDNSTTNQTTDTQSSDSDQDSDSGSSSGSSKSSYPKKVCTECGGSGICWGCDGTGYDAYDYGEYCYVCGGDGECPACLGTGWMSTHQNG